VFTEVGYPSREGSGTDPWDHRAERPVNLEVQRRCYGAFIETWKDVPELSGVFFYLWWGEGGAADDGYTPRNKPAAREMAGWFSSASN
jgi:Glycoside Hydrolase Family 113